MKNKGKKKQKQVFNIDELHFGVHFEEQLRLRFPQLTVEYVKQQMRYFKRGNMNSPFSQVRNKLANYAHQIVFYNQYNNMMLAVDPTNDNTVCTVMYLEPQK